MITDVEADELEVAFGRWRLLPARRRLMSDGVPVALGSRAFDVLLALVAAGGEVVTKDELLQRVWPGTIVEENNIQVQISALRRAFGDDARRLIATIPGRGYRFTGPLPAHRPVSSGSPTLIADKPAAKASRPALAVLPFRNLSGDPDEEFFADGMVEDLITALSHIRWFFVIARNSCFTYKGRAAPAPQVGRELGVQYVVEGAVRRAAGHVRVNVELVETSTGEAVWADHFDATIDNLFELQDRVVASIVGEVEPSLRRAELIRVRRPTAVFGAYDDYLRAMARMHPMTEANCVAALELLERALAADPGFPLALSAAGWCHMWRISQDTDNPDNPAREARAIALAEAAAAAAPDDPTVLAQAGIIFGYLSHRRQASVAFVERAVALHPNSALARSAAGWVNLYEGNAEAALVHLAEALRLDPLDPSAGEPMTGTCYALLLLERFDEAVQWGERAVAASPDRASAHRALVAALGKAGRPAKAVLARMLQIDPGFNLADFSRLRARHDGRPLAPAVLEGLRLAGVPESASSSLPPLALEAATPLANVCSASLDPPGVRGAVAAGATSAIESPNVPPHPATGRPLLIVLPFESIGSDPEQGYFVDGLTADLATDLTRFQSLQVVSPPRHAQDLQRALPEAPWVKNGSDGGTAYVVSGSIRRTCGRIRGSVQLKDARSGVSLWGERFDRALDDLFAVQEEVAEHLAAHVVSQVEQDGTRRARRRPPASLDAYDLCLRGRELYARATAADTLGAREMFARAIEADPDYAAAYAWQAFTVQRGLTHRWGEPRGRAAAILALQLARRAVEIEPGSPLCLAHLAFVLLLNGRWDEALETGRAAVLANPCALVTRRAYGGCLTHAGDATEAVQELSRALSLDPFHPPGLRADLGRALLLAGRIDEARAELRWSAARLPDSGLCRHALVVAAAETGRMDEARATLQELLRLCPDLTAGNIESIWFFRDPAVVERFRAAFHAAGLPAC